MFDVAVIPAVVKAVIVVAAIVPPSTLSPLIWLAANVKVPALTFNVLPLPTVISDVAIVAPSILPPSISGVLISGLVKVLFVNVCELVNCTILLFVIDEILVDVSALPVTSPVISPLKVTSKAPVPVIVGLV